MAENLNILYNSMMILLFKPCSNILYLAMKIIKNPIQTKILINIIPKQLSRNELVKLFNANFDFGI